MSRKHFTIPVFIPEMACPHQCIYCNQHLISGAKKIPDEKEVISIIEKYLSTIDYKNNEVEVGFFGGSFTGIPIVQQVNYLKLVQPYIEIGIVKSVRISTRPDYINEEVLKILKEYKVKTIELGAQSLDDEVLELSERGHTVAHVENAALRIKAMGFELGLQMMIGLPDDNLEKSIATAEKIIGLKANNTRIYPCLVIKNTKLENLYNQSKYKVLTINECVVYLKHLIPLFESADIQILRIGLHPSKDFDDGAFIAGPFHPSLRQLAETEIWFDKFKNLERKSDKSKEIVIYVSVNERNNSIGYQAKNKKYLEQYFKKVSFVIDNILNKKDYYVDIH